MSLKNEIGDDDMSVEIKLAYDRLEDVKMLFLEYTDMLMKLDDRFVMCLENQHYDEELMQLLELYGQPHGRLYVAYKDSRLAGCIALKKLDDATCEMKRMYVKGQFTGQGIGGRLVEKIIDEARKAGYKSMVLDTVPVLKSAVKLYKKHGFHEIEAYNNNPIEDTIYMKLEL